MDPTDGQLRRLITGGGGTICNILQGNDLSANGDMFPPS